MKKTDSYVYPALFAYHDDAHIQVSFPDLPGLLVKGAGDAHALEASREALGVHMWGLEKGNGDIPAPTGLCKLKMKSGEFSTLIEVYMPAIRLSQNQKSVNRTVTLPAWLNAAALEKGINFSQALQNALMSSYGIKQK